jgi:hypothetical protein
LDHVGRRRDDLAAHLPTDLPPRPKTLMATASLRAEP